MLRPIDHDIFVPRRRLRFSTWGGGDPSPPLSLPVFFTDTNGGNDISAADPLRVQHAPLQQLPTDLANGTVAVCRRRDRPSLRRNHS